MVREEDGNVGRHFISHLYITGKSREGLGCRRMPTKGELHRQDRFGNHTRRGSTHARTHTHMVVKSGMKPCSPLILVRDWKGEETLGDSRALWEPATVVRLQYTKYRGQTKERTPPHRH